MSTFPIIAPFWSDIDTTDNGDVWYRQLVRAADNEAIFASVDGIIVDAFVNVPQFSSSWMFIATWDSVPFYFSADDCDPLLVRSLG